VGFFKKLVIADNAAVIANEIFGKYESYEGADLWIGALAFTLQIYCDFSGYSDIARGLAKLLGFELMVNFRLPYLAQSPSDFWSRWHISLSTWLRDYLYIPLGGNRGSQLLTYRNLAITMLLGGLWHGASWNFVLWGGYHGLLLIAYRAWDSGGDVAIRPRAVRGLRIALMFFFTVIGWILFRARSFDTIEHFAAHLDFSISDDSAELGAKLAWLAGPLLALELFEHKKNDLLAIAKLWLPARVLVYTALLAALVLYAAREQTEFIYFQF
jgi:D-alanyl-lipoteichoic acid acyltransferase DltB (MBOAT superfamily)